ncbi:hypothetical protein RhiJN_05767 [Ceratobasidium sp. AG-Ba]|nr:hypothetical protein RhiJN_05767 [Ceratobasidium sp. AG-Ba]QRW06697.1 hypothetical protein RhiLY_05696 [Ceratobasidium sp. AG-Ba]
MAGDHGGKDDGGKHNGKDDGGKGKGMLRRAAAHVMPRTSADKDQPQYSQTPPAVMHPNPMETRASRTPKRSQTLDTGAAAKPPSQTPTSQGASEYLSPAPAAANPNPTAAQVPATVPPTLLPAPAPVVPPATPAKEHVERARSAEPQAQRERLMIEHIESLELRNKHLEERCKFYESDPYRNELTSIRTHLQVNDLLEPWQISQKFQAINKDVENVSRNLSEFLADSYTAKGPCNTGDFFLFSQNRPPKTDQQSGGTPVSAEDFVDFCCRSLINEQLMTKILHPQVFHPGLGSQENKFIGEMYESVRTKERQIIAGRWRISSFNAYKHIEFSAKNIALKLCQGALGHVCQGVYGEEPAETALSKVYPEIVAVFEHAWEWYSLAKSSVVLLDYEPFYIQPGSPYTPEHHALEGRKSKPPASGTILLTSRLGLISSEAQGEDKPPIRIIQSKATTLTAEYFLGS